MQGLLCNRSHCENKAFKFCVNCEAYLCKGHRIEDVLEQQVKWNREHYYIDASMYKKNEMVATINCKAHPTQTLSRICINCLKFTCNLCLPEWCPKAAGRYHDYNKMNSLVSRHKCALYELQQKLHQRHGRFLMELKEACQKQDRINSELADFLHKTDKAVESQIVAIREEGEQMKQEITHKISEILSQNKIQIKSIQEKEAISRKLLREICEIMRCPVDAVVILKYHKCKKETADVINWEITNSISPKFSLSQEPVHKYLNLKLTVESSVEAPDHHKKKEAGTIQKKKCTPYDPLQHYVSLVSVLKHGLSYGPHCAFFTNLHHNSHNFIRTRGGEEISSHTSNTVVHQLLPYGNQLLLLIRDWSNKYKIGFWNKDEVLYEFTDVTYSSVHFSPLYPHRLMAVTHDHKLIVLVKEIQTLHVLHLETNIEKDLTLSVGKRVYSILVPCDGSLILFCVESGENEGWSHSVIKYDTKHRKSIWISDPLLTGGRHCQLHVTCFNVFLYALSSDKPTTVCKLNLSDGVVMQRIQCGGLFPELVFDISLRGNVLATASDDRICFYEITDIAEVAV